MFLLFSLFGPLLIVANGGGTLTRSAAVVVPLLLFGLARGWQPVWGLYVVFSVAGLASTLSVSGGGLLPNVLCLLAYNVGSLALLFSPSMRAHVGIHSRRRARNA
jgi:hypothetical protein